MRIFKDQVFIKLPEVNLFNEHRFKDNVVNTGLFVLEFPRRCWQGNACMTG